MNNVCAPLVLLSTVPTCRWDFFLHVNEVHVGKSCLLDILKGVTGHAGPTASCHISCTGIPQAIKEHVIHKKKGGGISPHTWTDNTGLHQETAEPLLNSLRSCYTLQQPQLAGSHVSRVSGQQPAATGGQQTLPALYRALQKGLLQVRDPQEACSVYYYTTEMHWRQHIQIRGITGLNKSDNTCVWGGIKFSLICPRRKQQKLRC